MLQFFKKIIEFLSTHNIPYMLSGSVAMSLYVIPRATRDFDIIVHLKEEDIPALLAYFNEGFYCDEDAVREAVKRKSMFNIIDHNSSFKVDFVILKDEPYRLTEFDRRRKTDFFDTPIYVVTPEDLLISKLVWIQQLQSSLQKEDIYALKQISSLDWAYIDFWINRLKLNTFGLLDHE
ncbi:MAG: hypothetical protein J0I84_04675 [Terrimonas sp.]|nr:hypothetical protein [Terrimonas sp.]OJY99095.1 MAG: hypothetical protein BGP13_23905 [Sphingobacteriales bacterium 40-81]